MRSIILYTSPRLQSWVVGPAGISNILVFLIVGIWHGPEMHYVLWGLYNGLVIALSDLLKPAFSKLNELLHINTKNFFFKVFQIIRTFIIVNIGWYFDRIYDVPKSFIFLKNTFTNFQLKELKTGLNFIFADVSHLSEKLLISGFALVVIFISSIFAERNDGLYVWYKKQNVVIRWSCLYLLLFVLIFSFSNPNGNVGFMYANY